MTLTAEEILRGTIYTCARCGKQAPAPIVVPNPRRGKPMDRCTNTISCGNRRRQKQRREKREAVERKRLRMQPR